MAHTHTHKQPCRRAFIQDIFSFFPSFFQLYFKYTSGTHKVLTQLMIRGSTSPVAALSQWGAGGRGRGDVGLERSGNCCSAAVSTVQINDEHSSTSATAFMMAALGNQICFFSAHLLKDPRREFCVSFFFFFFFRGAILMGGKGKVVEGWHGISVRSNQRVPVTKWKGHFSTPIASQVSCAKVSQ